MCARWVGGEGWSNIFFSAITSIMESLHPYEFGELSEGCKPAATRNGFSPLASACRALHSSRTRPLPSPSIKPSVYALTATPRSFPASPVVS